jgi:hypothetical protein
VSLHRIVAGQHSLLIFNKNYLEKTLRIRLAVSNETTRDIPEGATTTVHLLEQGEIMSLFIIILLFNHVRVSQQEEQRRPKVSG